MDINLKIEHIKTVFEGEFNPGTIPQKKIGRSCDGFVYVLFGDVEYLFDGYSFHATPKNFIYLAKGSIYGIRISEKSKFICIDFDFESNSRERKSDVYQTGSPTLKNDFTKILYIWSKKSPWYLPQVFSLLYDVYFQAVKTKYRQYVQKNELISKITSYVLQHYTESSFSVRNIADYIGISETHLRRIFRQAFNISPIEYVKSLRLDKAKNMLQISNYTIGEIAASVGFEDPYYFSRFFKRETGLSPMEYKQTNPGF